MASDGSDVTQLSHFSAADPAVWLPAWMNDGKGILATRTVRATRENDIVAISPDGSALRELGIGGAHARQAASDERNRRSEGLTGVRPNGTGRHVAPEKEGTIPGNGHP
jgi:hypothetical protein